MRKLIVGTLLGSMSVSPAFACFGSTGYEWGPDGNIEAVCSNMQGPSLSTGGGGGAAPTCHSKSCADEPLTGRIWDSPFSDAMGVFAGAAGFAASVAGGWGSGVAGALGFGAAVSNAYSNGNIGISPQSVTSAPDGAGIGPGPSGEGD